MIKLGNLFELSDMSMEDVRNYEKDVHKKTNEIVGVSDDVAGAAGGAGGAGAASNASPLTPTNTPTGNTPESERDEQVD